MPDARYEPKHREPNTKKEEADAKSCRVASGQIIAIPS